MLTPLPIQWNVAGSKFSDQSGANVTETKFDNAVFLILATILTFHSTSQYEERGF